MPNTDPPSLGLGDEVDAASRAFDIAETPLGLTLLQLASVEFRNAALEAQANREFAQLQGSIVSALSNPQVGFLIEISIYRNEFGNVVIPGGQMLYPIGIGTEPIDAYSEYLRKKLIRAEPTEKLENETHFVWITQPVTKLLVQTIPKEFRRSFRRKAVEEAAHRDALGVFEAAFPPSGYINIQRAQYWTEVMQENLLRIADEKKRIEIANLTSRMRELDAEANMLYRKHKETMASMQRSQSFASILDKISAVASLIKSGIELNEIMSKSDASPVTGNNLQPTASLPATLEITERKLQTDGKNYEITERQLRIKFNDYRELERILEWKYNTAGVPLPEREPIKDPPY